MIDFRPVLIIVGAWNTPLLSVKWINDNLFDSTLPQTIQSELIVSYDRLSLKRYKLGKLTLEITPNRLVFLCEQDDVSTLAKIVDMANEILTKLPHTPVESFGINIMLTSNKTSPDNINSIPIEGYTNEAQYSKSTSYSCIENDKHTLNVGITFKGENTEYNFNFHHNTSDIGMIKQILVNDIFEQYKLKSKEFVESYEKLYES